MKLLLLTFVLLLLLGCFSTRVVVVMSSPEPGYQFEPASMAGDLKEELARKFGFKVDRSVGGPEHIIMTKIDRKWGVLAAGVRFEDDFEVWVSGPPGFQDSDQCKEIQNFILGRLREMGLKNIETRLGSSSFA